MPTNEERQAAFEQLVIENARLEKENGVLKSINTGLGERLRSLELELVRGKRARKSEFLPIMEEEIKEEVRREVLQTLSEKFGWQWYD